MTGRAFRDVLIAAGLRPTVAERKAILLDQATIALRSRENGSVASRPHVVWVPGRVEVLGKHTDYAGGRSLVCAADRGIVAVSIPRTDGRLVVIDATTGLDVSVSLVVDANAPGVPWSTYVEAVARRVARNFPASTGGATVALASDLPQAAGLSSSSALVVAVFVALANVSWIEASAAYRNAIHTPEDLAGYLATVENGLSYGDLVGDRGVGTFGGSEDHTAMLCGRSGHFSQFAFCPVRRETEVSLAEPLVLAVASSGVVAEKTGSARDAYNRAARAAALVLDRWNRATGRADASLGAACAVSFDAPDRIRDAVDQGGDDPDFPVSLLRLRFDQFWEESSTIVPGASAALTAGDLATFASLTARSQELAEHYLNNQVPETSYLARSALRLGGLAASAFGAGFGGSVWALVARERAPGFLSDWRRDYLDRFPSRSAGSCFFDTRPGPPVSRQP